MGKKTIGGCFLKGLLIILLVIIGLLLISYGFYRLTKEKESAYIPSNYLGYVKINSLMAAYNNLIDLKAAELILTEMRLNYFYKSILEFKNIKFTKNKLLTSMLNMKVHAVINKDYSTLLIFDLGYKSILLRSSQFLIKFLKNQKDFTVETIIDKENKYTLYKLILPAYEQPIYLSVRSNLLFFSFNKTDIDKSYKIKKTGNNLLNDKNFNEIKNKIKKNGIAELYLNTQDVLNTVLKDLPQIKNLTKHFQFEANTAIAFNISNQEMNLNTYTSYTSQDPEIKKFLNYQPDKLDVIDYLPENTNLYTILNIHSFEEFYKLFLYLQSGQYDNQIKLIDNACRTLFQLSIDEVLFSWIGSKIGVYSTENTAQPVIFIKIKDKAKLNIVLKKLINSIVFEQDENLIYNNVELERIKFPDFILSILQYFVPNIDTPYYTKIKDYIFFSMDPEALSNLVLKYQYGKTLKFDPLYKKITSRIENNANLFVYFNMAQSIPKFLQQQSIISKILQLYEKGTLAINFNESELKLDLATAGVNVKKTKLFPGFPKKAGKDIVSPIICSNLTGSGLAELLYITGNNYLYATDFNNELLEGFPVKIDGDCRNAPLVADLDQDGIKEIYVFTEKGVLHKFDPAGKENQPYPIDTGCKSNLPLVEYYGKFLIYSKDDKKLYILRGTQIEEFKFEFKSPLISPVTINYNLFTFYPKTFSGTIYLTDNEGQIQNGWPVDAGGIGFGSPQIREIKSNSKNVIFLTQSGSLNVWKIDGTSENGFPVQLNGSFYNQPEIGNLIQDKNNELVVLNSDGQITIINANGEIKVQQKINDADSKERNILLFDADRDGRDEIFIYNGKNSIIALNNKLELLPGFPVKGYTKPDFSDFNSDGEYEMVTSTVNNEIMIYTIPR